MKQGGLFWFKRRKKVPMQIINRMGQYLAEYFGESTPLDVVSSQSEHLMHLLDQNYLGELVPYCFYNKEKKIYENKNSCGFILELPPVLGMSSTSQSELSHMIRDIGEEGASIQCLMWADSRIEPILNRWTSSRIDKGGVFRQIALRKTEFFSRDLQEGDIQPRIFRFLLSYSLPKLHINQTEELLNKLSNKRKKAIASLSRFTSVSDITPQELIEIQSGFLKGSKQAKVENLRKWNEHSILSNQMLPPSGMIEVKADGLIFKNHEETCCLKTYEAVDFPDHWAMNMNQELLGDFINSSYRFSAPFFIHYGIFFPKQERLETRFKSKSKVLDHQCKFPALLKMFPNMPRERDENTYVSRQILEGELFVETRLSVGLLDTPDQFLRSESILLALYQKYGFKLKENAFHHLNDWISSLPMAWGENVQYMRDFKRRVLMRTTLTKETGNFIPLVGEWWGNSTKGMPLLGRRGQLATWDLFCGQGNLNAVVVGASGSGKSVFMQEMIMSELGQGGRVFVLDLGRSFENLCHLIGGQHLFFTHASRLNLNPFNLVKNDGQIESVNTSLEMVTSIIATMAIPTQKIDKERADILSSIVKKVWEEKGSQATIDDVINKISTMSFHSELMKGVSESLYEGLQKFSRNGVYRDYFYGAQKINFQSDLVVIETEELKNMPDLQAVILQIFALTISNQVFMGDREKRSLICIDEAWDLLKSPQMEGFIESMARRLRKYNGALVVGTQGFKDFERSPGAKAALQNSNWILMLGKDDESINILKRDHLIPMDEYKEKMLSSLRKEDGKYSEVFIYHKGSGFFTLSQLRLDPFSALLYSTRATDFQGIQELQRCGLNIEESIDWMITHREEVLSSIENGERLKGAIQRLLTRASIKGLKT